MSDFDDASLVMIPSGYKTSKVYSVKPTDGTGDLSFTRALDTATRVAPNGLIEKVRTNLILQSQTFDNAGWTKEGCAVTANTTIAPDGTLTGDLIVENAAAATQHRLLQPRTISNSTEHTTSVFVKRVTGTRDFAIINITSGARVYFNLTTGAVGNEVLGTGSIQDVGNGWFRCTATGVSTGTSLNVFLALTNATTTGSETYSGDGVSSLAFWGAQLESGVATPYIPTTFAAVSVGMLANVPRLDYTGGGCPKLLLEPQRVNVTLQSETITAATGTTVTLNTTTAPTGLNTADKLVEDTSTGLHFTSFGGVLGGTTDSSVYCVSIFAKAAGRTRLVMFDNGQVAAGATNFDLSNGTATSGTGRIENYGNGWYRCTIFPAKSTSTIANVQIRMIDAGTNTSYTGNGTSGLFLWGKQIEPSATYATSYIPTLGAAVTRSADAASKTGISALIGQTAGTIYAEVDSLTNADNSRAIAIQGGGSRMGITISGTEIGYFVVTSAGLIISTTFAQTAATKKVALAYQSGTTALFCNGVLVNSDATTYTLDGALAELYLGQREFAVGTGQNAQRNAQALLFKTRLTNAQLAELTTI